jgi:CheY-like chemotaxis protein
MGKILHAEDDEDDAFLLSHAFRKVGIAHVVVRVEDGQAAITYLSENPRPDLVILDLKMPTMGGFDVLAFMRGKPEFKDLPVIVLTASELPEDVAKVKSMDCGDYFVKTTDWKAIATALKSRLDTILVS